MNHMIMKSRILIPLCIAVSCAGLDAAQNPPWRVIYNNDTTNILNCVSPYNKASKERPRMLAEEQIRASVREAVRPGVDAQLISPAHSWVPWWPSKIIPLAEHEQWFRERYGVEPDLSEHRYLLAGGDILGVFIDECHKNNVAALISFRCNDGHHQERTWDEKVPGEVAHALNRFYVEHPEYRLGPPPSRLMKDRVHNWLIPEARAHKERMLAEIVEIYPALDGIELDFLRHPYYFPDDTPMAVRVEVMCDFIGKIRILLEQASAKNNEGHRYLGARIPVNEAEWRDIGLDPDAWRKAGIDYFNVSPSYRLTQQTNVAALRQAAPDARIYLELTHTPQTWKFGGPGYDDHTYRRSTKEMLETTARIGYARGADGMSFFNFAYYREHGGCREQRRPFNEPPFEELSAVASSDALAGAPGYFFQAQDNVLFVKGQKRGYTMDIAPAKGNKAGALRLQLVTTAESRADERAVPEKIARGEWKVVLNGVELKATEAGGKAYPFPTPFKAGFGGATQYLAWQVPAGLLANGGNHIDIIAVNPPEGGLRLKWIDIIQNSSE
ncbi:hypothetical protein AW736_15640 [Termitidicoccus mucosus]|uniref:Glycosyl hydrolase-like 10 domain-containing protein n=1 Tax=Termitidicoccus mucosus TaxID=1184151 RepID=A0A178IG17_9BACT|nr:hypothetical protein AW736_15640 [Opitutaceae bacterium TSB47]